jgi:Family of unknown function (DUF6493)
LLHILHGKASADDLECALDGLTRLCNERPQDFALRTQALKSQAQRQLAYRDKDLPWDRTPFIGNDYKSDTAALILVWLDIEQFKQCFASLLVPSIQDPILSTESLEAALSTPQGLYKAWGSYSSRVSLYLHIISKVTKQLESGKDKWDDFQLAFRTYTDLVSEVRHSQSWFYSCRFLELTERITSGRAVPLLSTPTHKNGWIDPLVIPERLALIEKAKSQIGFFDFMQMLLRLAPDHRADTLIACKDLRGEHGDLLRFALGGTPPTEMKNVSLWIATARCRCPFGNDQHTLARFGDLGPDGSNVAVYDETVDGLEELTDDSPRWSDSSLLERHNKFLRATSLVPASLKSAQFPTINLHLRSAAASREAIYRGFWPQNRESIFANEVRWISGSLYSPGYPLGDWEPIFDPDMHVNGMACWMIALGLSAKKQDTARVATDALIACIEDGRLDATRFAEVLGKLMRTKLITFTRWQSGFSQAAKVSALHAQFIQITLEQSLKQLPTGDARPPLKMLDLLFELSNTTGEQINDLSSRQYLENIAGSGKGTKLAKALLQRSEDSRHAHRKLAANYALEKRIERAKRWQSSLTTEALVVRR